MNRQGAKVEEFEGRAKPRRRPVRPAAPIN
jgi:hypothetical protein